ncbi:hypothetical protein CSC2_00410 [Clostridium zeae]|uniref:Uncharacterized protein n=1 Tax=Clostridium zeae TaxID=2759022 RepID=A0ABQ1E451_9CLOT|nr:sigma 54-interacting transcriptional regulator [Clostridium zeae]GFZ29515.1 hypothetical protein CSC2_00410 [Clostridium zeae]
MRRLDAVYEKLKVLYCGHGLSAIDIAEELNLSRSNVSNDLNRLFEAGKVNKINGRPVLFSPIEIRNARNYDTRFDEFAENNPSLLSAVQQSKAAILYPPKGMDILIFGNTGVGKSMFAEMTHQYAVEVKRIRSEASLITFNCADYASNPQLLLAQLFGVKKGAYTGADIDKVGLIEKADKGILFLDEVHRLPPEGQEIFFNFIDKGTFRRLGETEIERKADVIIIAATTESLDFSLLKTFTRRFPMIITLPDLSKRTYEERFRLVNRFFEEEAKKFNREIMVSVNSIRVLLSYQCINNIGQLKNDIQIICARAFLNFLSNKEDIIKINDIDIPDHIKDGVYENTEDTLIYSKLRTVYGEYCVFKVNDKSSLLRTQDEKPNIYEIIEFEIKSQLEKGERVDQIKFNLEQNLNFYIQKYVDSIDFKFNHFKSNDVFDNLSAKVTYKIIEFCEENFKRNVDKSIIKAITMHIENLKYQIKRKKNIVNNYLSEIMSKYPFEMKLAEHCIKIIENFIDISIPQKEVAVFAAFLVYGFDQVIQYDGCVKVIVIAHGNTTASSMVEAVNKLLGVRYSIGIDFAFNENPQELILRVISNIRKLKTKSDILLLIDMDPLINLELEIEKILGVKVKTIPFASTMHVVEATKKAMLGKSLAQVYNETLEINRLFDRLLLSNEMIFDDNNEFLRNLDKKINISIGV